MGSQQVLAAHAAADGQPGGLFLLAWGLMAAEFGPAWLALASRRSARLS
jgi:hypothetical protein